jgi:DNA-directed RNA polymerase subunit RPC12/RpoP
MTCRMRDFCLVGSCFKLVPCHGIRNSPPEFIACSKFGRERLRDLDLCSDGPEELRQMQCSNCGGKHLLRMRRTGFLEIRLFPAFGFYPWKCTDCKAKLLLRDRGKKRRKLTPQTSSQR